MSVTTTLAAVQVLAPLVAEVAAYLRGGDVPTFFVTLPDTLRSRVVLDALKAQVR
jgi:hypothetical protein